MFRKAAQTLLKEKQPQNKQRTKVDVIRKYWSNVFLNHLCWLYCFVVIIYYIRIDQIDPSTQLAVVFEVMSAYGNVGYSYGSKLDTSTLSRCAEWQTSARLCLLIAMVIGRNRGLPYHIYFRDMRDDVKQEVALDLMDFNEQQIN